MSNEDANTIARIAEQVSVLMQLDRMRHHVGTEVDMRALGNVPDYIASVFEQANTASPELSPAQFYDLVNKRVSQIQAQLYLMRLEMENRAARDPARIYADPLAISAYGEEMETRTTRPRSFDFGPAILAYGWFPIERDDEAFHRWMRPGEASVACVPHLGQVDQVIEITGYVMHEEQMDGLTIRALNTEAEIDVTESGPPTRFRARLALSAAALKASNYVPVEFQMPHFMPPNTADTRMLGANIHGFDCWPASWTVPEADDGTAPEAGDGTAPEADADADAPQEAPTDDTGNGSETAS